MALGQQCAERQVARLATSVAQMDLMAQAVKAAVKRESERTEAERSELRQQLARALAERDEAVESHASVEAHAAAQIAALKADLAEFDGTAISQSSVQTMKARHKAELKRQAEEAGQKLRDATFGEQGRIQREVDRALAASRSQAEEALSRVRLQGEEQLMVLKREAAVALEMQESQRLELAASLDSLQKSNGRTVAKLERVTTELEALKGQTQGGDSKGSPQSHTVARLAAHRSSSRTRERRIMTLETEVEAARKLVAELRGKLQDTAFEPGSRRAQTSQAVVMPAAKLRTSVGAKGFAQAPLEARTLEHLRRLVEETNCSLQGASTANAIVLQLQTGQQPNSERLICAESVKRAFTRLGVIDRAAEADVNSKDDAPWALSYDAGNKGRAIQMMAISRWNRELQEPETRPLGAADLFGDQSAKNGSMVHMAALKAAGYRPELIVAGISDGTEHAVQEMATTVHECHVKGGSAEASRAMCEFCCIHGKALEENHGMEAAYPGNYLVDALRLLWEIFHSPEGGRLGEYRRIWVKDCGFSEALFDSTLGSLPEPTSAKWQVVYGVCEKLLPVLERVTSGSNRLLDQDARPSYLETFLDVCRLLMCGSLDNSKQDKVAHPHTHKIQSLTGIFRALQVEAGIYLIIDMGEANYRGFYAFAKRPSR